MGRMWLIGVGLVVAVLAIRGFLLANATSAQPPIVVGILHSQTGPLAATEKPMIEAEVLALEEINKEGGLLGRPLKWIIADGRSQEAAFAQQAHRLIADERVSVIFGVCASYCRKAVKSVVEEQNHLLFYPAPYEGAEASPNIVYAGGPANQQITPALSWCIDTLKARKFFLVGSDSVGPRVMGALTRDQLKGLGGEVVGESFLLPESTDVSAVIDAIKQAAPDMVISHLEGETNTAFYESLARAGMTPERTPVLSFSITEEELRTLSLKDMAGHYAARKYVQSLDRSENTEFVRKFKARWGPDRVTSDRVSAAYSSVKLWARAVAEAKTADALVVRDTVYGVSLNAPEAVISVDFDNLHVWRPSILGKIRADGQFDIVFMLPKPVFPIPYPTSRPKAEWDALLSHLSAGWGGQWSNPARVTAGSR